MIRRLLPDDAPTLLSLRLAALVDAPGSFASSYEREVAFADEEWRARLHPDANPTFVWDERLDADVRTSLIVDREHGTVADGDLGTAVGMAVGARDENDPTLSHLFGMWVRPDARGGPAADALVGAVLAWAVTTGVSSIQLHVANGNHRAEHLYARHGFVRTGTSADHPCGDGTAFEMVRPLP